MHRYLLPAIVSVFLLIHTPLDAQQPAAGAQSAQPGVVVVSYNKCAMDAPPKLDSIAALTLYPVLDELVRENRLLGWGVLTHAWGDEWNYVIYYTAANTPAFHAAWAELMQRVRLRRPTFMADFGTYCSEHKDNIYSVMRVGGAPPPPR